MERKKNLEKRWKALQEIHSALSSETLAAHVNNAEKQIAQYRQETDRRKKTVSLAQAEESLKDAERRYTGLLRHYSEELIKYIGSRHEARRRETLHGKPVLSHKDADAMVNYYRMTEVELGRAQKAERDKNWFYANHLYTRTLKYSLSALKSGGLPVPDEHAAVLRLK